MQTEQLTILAFSILGIVAGFVSNYLDVIMAVLVAFSIYTVSTILFLKFAKSKKTKILVINGMVTFLPIWLIVWIFLFNSR